MRITRRAALKGTAAVAIVTAVSTVPAAFANTEQDADLETWEAQLHACEQRCEGVGGDDERVNAIGEQHRALDWKIAKAETNRPRGLAVKVRRLRVSFEEGEADWDKENIRTLLVSLERMT
jgi:multidrug resistance efflux pump